MTTAYVTHMRYLEHTLDEHPENAERLRAIWRRLEDAGVLGDLTALEPAPATQSQMEAIHQRRYLEMLASTRTATVMLDPDTYALPVSYEVACLSAGGVVRAVDAVLRSEADNALALTRPPGHHARPGRGMGFCLLNNVAIAARYAQSAFGLERILIADYDVHHGNGTQEVFYADPEVLYISTHQYPFYPGTGALGDTGIGAGQGTTINLPLRTGVGDEGYARLYAEVVWPAARRFSPQLIIVSAGFDAHWAEPLAGMNLSLAGYAHLTSALVAMANELCGGRIVFALEGGYNHDVLGNATLNACHALLGRDQVIDPLGRAGREEPSVERLLEEAKRIHQLR